MGFDSSAFWIALLQIIGVNIVLSGDNAVVIALAARGLPPAQQKKAIAWGSAAAVVMRIVLTIVAVELLRLPFLKLIGAGLLAWIAVKLLIPEDDDDGSDRAHHTGMAAAIWTILLADLVMSLDNVIAVAAAAKGDVTLLVIGLAISIPLVIFASRLLLGLMERFPLIITLGAGVLGWVAGEMLISDPVVKPSIDAGAAYLHAVAPALGAIAVIAAGRWLAVRAEARRKPVELVAVPAAAVPVPVAGARRIVLAVDGSTTSLGAVRQVIGMRSLLPAGIDLAVDLVNVQRPLPSEVASSIDRDALHEYHREKSDAALAEAAALLDAAGIAYTRHHFVGEPGRLIAQHAADRHADEIVMGTRGLGTHTGALLGSVTRGTIEHATVPVLVVR
jgi:YjbE family integral membrane protein